MLFTTTITTNTIYSVLFTDTKLFKIVTSQRISFRFVTQNWKPYTISFFIVALYNQRFWIFVLPTDQRIRPPYSVGCHDWYYSKLQIALY